MKNIYAALRSIEESNPVRAILLELMQTIEKAKHPDVSRILPILVTYAGILRERREYTLALDTLQTILHFSDDPPGETQFLAMMDAGHCQRMLGQWDAAAESFAAAGQMAAATGDRAQMLVARIADAELMAERGNASQAEMLLDDVIMQTTCVDELSDVRKAGLLARSALGMLRGGFDEKTPSPDPAKPSTQSL